MVELSNLDVSPRSDSAKLRYFRGSRRTQSEPVSGMLQNSFPKIIWEFCRHEINKLWLNSKGIIKTNQTDWGFWIGRVITRIIRTFCENIAKAERLDNDTPRSGSRPLFKCLDLYLYVVLGSVHKWRHVIIGMEVNNFDLKTWLEKG